MRESPKRGKVVPVSGTAEDASPRSLNLPNTATPPAPLLSIAIHALEKSPLSTNPVMAASLLTAKLLDPDGDTTFPLIGATSSGSAEGNHWFDVAVTR